MQKIPLKQTFLALLLGVLSLPPLAVADEACVALGGMVWDNWTKSDAGGAGTLPVGENQADYLRCKSCHGWDRLGTDGGYVRRSRTATRPNAGLGDGDNSSRNVDTGILGKHAPINTGMILHSANGRGVTEGSGAWVAPVTPRAASNTAAYQKGYTLGNQHPDYTGLLTEKQVSCLVEFLNSPESQPSSVFKRLIPAANPVVYQLVDTADANAGKLYYEAKCTECHGLPDDDQSNTVAGLPKGGLIAYLKEDGKFSEFAHKAYFGIPDTTMTRRKIGNPTLQDVANVMKYLQEFGSIVAQDRCGKSNSLVTSVAQDGALMQDTKLHIPRVGLALPDGDVTYWATLRYAPELSPNGKLVFELADAEANSGRCN
ncbi:MAG: c-type cytochrome [Methylococcales bacterium]